MSAGTRFPGTVHGKFVVPGNFSLAINNNFCNVWMAKEVLANKKKEKDGEHLAAVTNDFLFLFLLEIVLTAETLSMDQPLKENENEYLVGP